MYVCMYVCMYNMILNDNDNILRIENNCKATIIWQFVWPSAELRCGFDSQCGIRIAHRSV